MSVIRSRFKPKTESQVHPRGQAHWSAKPSAAIIRQSRGRHMTILRVQEIDPRGAHKGSAAGPFLTAPPARDRHARKPVGKFGPDTRFEFSGARGANLNTRSLRTGPDIVQHGRVGGPLSYCAHVPFLDASMAC